jgi:hypothetical protein
MYPQKQEVVLFGTDTNVQELKEYIPEIKVRMNKGKTFDVDTVKTSQNVYDMLKRVYCKNLFQEHFVVLLFNRANKLIGFYKHTIGSSNATLADIPMIIGIVTKSLAQSVIISHNHPSGSKTPSDADKQLTKKVKTALDSVGITMLDHMIYTENGYFSFADDGMLNGILNTQTMITVENILENYPQILQDILPKALQQVEFAFIEENIDLYDDDETIKQYIDTFVEKLNEVVKKHENSEDIDLLVPEQIDQSEPDGQKYKLTRKSKKQSKSKTENQTKSKVKPKVKTETKESDIVPDEVDFISPEVKFIKRYIGLHEKSKDKAAILSFINALQRSIVEKRIRKTSGYASEIEKIQDELIACYVEMGKTIRLTIKPDTLKKYTEIIKSEEVKAIVRLIKQYISLHGKTEVKKQAKSLFNRIQKAIDNGDISYSDVRYNEIHVISESLVAYLQDETNSIEIKESELHGLMGLAGISVNGLNGLETDSTQCIPSSKLADMQFQTIGLQGKYRNLIGDPSVGFTAMVFGLPKSGKSTLCIDFARYLAEHHGKVLYVAIEEGFGYTLQEKFERLHAIHPNLVIAEKLPADLSKWDFVFIDSVSKAGYTTEELTTLHKQFPKTSFIYVFHTTKDGKFRGGQQFAHDVDCIVDVVNGEASANGRFGVGGKMNVFEN